MKTEKYLINEEGLKIAQDQKALEAAYKEGKTMQDLFGFSNEVMLDFYKAAVTLYEERRYEDSLAAFIFLSTVNPGVPCFWKGKGLCFEGLQKWDQALRAYDQAIMANPTNIDGYGVTIRFLLEQRKDPDAAAEWIDYGKKIFQTIEDETEAKNFKSDLAQLHHLVKEAKGS